MTPKDDAMLRDLLRAGVAPPWQLAAKLLAERDALVAERDALRARLGGALRTVDDALAAGTVSGPEGAE